MDAERIPCSRLYDDLAWLMPVLCLPEDFADQARRWLAVLREKLGPGRHPLLVLGAGAGNLLWHLTSEFEITAVDLSEDMLARCQRLNPGVTTQLGDMRSVRLGRTFSAVLIHDAISYMRTEVDLEAAFTTAAAHLRPGGVLVANPDYFQETFHGPLVAHDTRVAGDTELTFVEYKHVPTGSSLLETVVTLYIRRSGVLSVELDRHVTGLFPLAVWQRLMHKAGLACEVRSFPVSGLERPYTLLVGVLQGGMGAAS